MFRRPPPIRDREALAQFIDEHAAFLVQKGIYEYARARAGHYAKVLMVEPEFLQAVERSRWQAYPLGLAMVAELVYGVLRSRVPADRELLDGLIDVTLAVFDRYPVSAELGAQAWKQGRRELAHNLDLISLRPLKRAMDIPLPFAKAYFETMPIHEKLRGPDFPTLRNYLRVTLCHMHDEFSERLDAAPLVAALRGRTAAEDARRAP
jgi:hypothetical protein